MPTQVNRVYGFIFLLSFLFSFSIFVYKIGDGLKTTEQIIIEPIPRFGKAMTTK